MNIAKDSVVRFHYSVSEPGQPALDSSHGRDPLAVLIGYGAIVPGLEEALLGRAAGERFEVTLSPEQGYGPRNPQAVQRVSKKHLHAHGKLQPGAQVLVQTRQGMRPVTVLKVGMSVVDIDLNHPLAGKSLQFEVEVVEVRAASAEEIAHGHVHGAGGHRH